MSEFIRSPKALELKIDNTPSETAKANLPFTMAGMERVRALLKHPIKILSGYRSKELNYAVNGSVLSQHMRGEACDFTCPAFGTPYEVALVLNEYVEILGIDQLILERTWVHISFTYNPRYEVLTFKEGKYSRGI